MFSPLFPLEFSSRCAAAFQLHTPAAEHLWFQFLPRLEILPFFARGRLVPCPLLSFGPAFSEKRTALKMLNAARVMPLPPLYSSLSISSRRVSTCCTSRLT